MSSWEANIRRVIPYTPGEQPDQPDIIKLNTNENPYPPAPGVMAAKDRLSVQALRLYPDPLGNALVEALALRYGLSKEQVFVGVGSDDVLAMSFLTFFNSDKPILFPDITYSFYDVWAGLYRIPFKRPSLNEAFRIVKEDYFGENGGIILANPNAPTAIYEPLVVIEEICARNQDVIVIVDEAYIDFADGPSAVSLLPRYKNLLVVQTFSKSRSMAGMRIGYAMGSPELIKALNDVKYSFNSYTMNLPSLTLGVEAVRDEAYFQETIQKIVTTRAWVKEELAAMGFDCTDSAANFLFVTHPDWPAKQIFEALKEKNIYVRYFNKPRIDNYLRITIGTDDEMKQVIEVLKREGFGKPQVSRL